MIIINNGSLPFDPKSGFRPINFYAYGTESELNAH